MEPNTLKIRSEIGKSKKPKAITSFRIHPILKKRLHETAKEKEITVSKLIESYILFGLSLN